MKNYIGLFCMSLLFLSGCGKSKKSKEGSNIPFFKNTQKKNKAVNYKKTAQALNENLEAFALEQDSLKKGISLSDKDMNLFAFDNSPQSNKADENPLFKWENMQQNNGKDNFDNLYFEFDKYTLADSQKAPLKKDIELAKEQCVVRDGKDATIIVEGHSCHSAGSAAYNMALSEKRARYVAEQLTTQAGVDKDKLRIAPRGQEMPLVRTGNKKAQAPNRRVELITINTNNTAPAKA